MQKKANKWSVLIWSIFLVLFMSFSFLVSSRQVSDNIRKIWLFKDIISNDLVIPTDLFKTNFYWLIKNKESIELRFSNTITSTWRLFLESGWPLQYKTLVVNPTNWNSHLWSTNWILNKWNYVDFELNLNWWFSNWILYLRNLWWLSKVIVQSNSNFLASQSFLENRDLIWNKEVPNNKIFIKNYENWFLNSNFQETDYIEDSLYIDN